MSGSHSRGFTSLTQVLRAASLLTCGLVFAHSALAANDELAEHQKRVKKAEVIGALGADMFGDSVNYYNGAVSFSVTDIDIPGNSSLPVGVGRTFSAADTDYPTPSGAFGDWELDLPHMKGTFPANNAWKVYGANPDNRCSGTTTQLPVTVTTPPPGGGTFTGNQYWRGNVLYVPGAGAQNILRSTVLPQPADGLTKFYTSKFWQIRCGVPLANAGTNGFAGEGFLALAPDGTKYRFDWMTTRIVEGLQINNGPGVPSPILSRVEARIYPTRMTGC